MHSLPGQCSCSQLHLALEEQGLLPHADSQTERGKIPQRGARIQIFSVQTTPAQVETHGIQENCPRDVRGLQSAAPCKAAAANSHGGQTMLCTSLPL